MCASSHIPVTRLTHAAAPSHDAFPSAGKRNGSYTGDTHTAARASVQECEGLKKLLSVKRDRSVQAAIDVDSHLATSRRRCEELEQALQASRHECDNARRELETVLRSSSFSNNSADNSSSFSSNSADDEDNGVRNVRRYMSPASRRQYPRPNHVVRE